MRAKTYEEMLSFSERQLQYNPYSTVAVGPNQQYQPNTFGTQLQQGAPQQGIQGQWQPGQPHNVQQAQEAHQAYYQQQVYQQQQAYHQEQTYQQQQSYQQFDQQQYQQQAIYQQPYQQPYEEPYQQPFEQPYEQQYQQPYEQQYQHPYEQQYQQPYQQPHVQPYQQPHEQPYQPAYQHPYEQPYEQIYEEPRQEVVEPLCVKKHAYTCPPIEPYEPQDTQQQHQQPQQVQQPQQRPQLTQQQQLMQQLYSQQIKQQYTQQGIYQQSHEPQFDQPHEPVYAQPFGQAYAQPQQQHYLQQYEQPYSQPYEQQPYGQEQLRRLQQYPHQQPYAQQAEPTYPYQEQEPYPQSQQPGQQQPGQHPHEQRYPKPKRRIQPAPQPQQQYPFGEAVKWKLRAQPQYDEQTGQPRPILHPFYHPLPTLQQHTYHMEHQPIIPQQAVARQQQQIQLLPQRPLQQAQLPPQEHPFYHPQSIQHDEQPFAQPIFMQQHKPHYAQSRTSSHRGSRENTIDSLDSRKDEPIWVQMKREKDKQRSKSLQPMHKLEDIPWLRPKRDKSEPPKEEFILRGRHGVPIRPWIDEVIRLKRTELVQKVVERTKLEKVALKQSQIERKEITKEELEKIDLKCIQLEQALTQHFIQNQIDQQGQQGMMQQLESDFVIDKKRYEDNMTILELTQQIDQLIQRDSSRGVPWDVQKQQLKTIERTQKMINKIDAEDQIYKSTGRFPHESQEIIVRETITDVEDTIILKLDKDSAMQIAQREQAIAWARGKNVQLIGAKQAISNLEDSTFLNLSQQTEQDIRKIQQMQQEVPVMWDRGKRPKEPQTGATSHVEDSTILQLDKSFEQDVRRIEQTDQEVAKMWQRGKKQVTTDKALLSYQEDSTFLQLDERSEREVNQLQQVEQETAVMWQRGKKQKPSGLAVLSHVEDTNLLDLQQETDEDIRRIQQVDQEVAVTWERGKKKKSVDLGALQHVEDTTLLDVQRQAEEDIAQIEKIQQEPPVMWERGKKKKPIDSAALSHVEDTSISDLQPRAEEEVEPVEQEIPVMWQRGKKNKEPQQIIEDATILQVNETQEIEATEEEKPVAWKRGPKPAQPTQQVAALPAKEVEEVKTMEQPKVTETAVPWLQSRKELKSAPRKQVEQPKKPHEMTEVQLKPGAKAVREVIAPAVEEVAPLESFTEQPVMSEPAQFVAQSPEIVEQAIELPDLIPEQPQDVEKAPWRRAQKEKPIEEKPEEKQWPSGKRKPKEPETVEKVELKPIPRKQSVPEQKAAEKLEPRRKSEPTVKDADVPTQLPEEHVKAVEETISAEPAEAVPTPWIRGKKQKPVEEQLEEKQWPTGKRRPQEPETVEKVELKPIPRKKSEPEVKPVEVLSKPTNATAAVVEDVDIPAEEERPQGVEEAPAPEVITQEEPTPWRRGKKEKPVDKVPEEKQWPIGKRKVPEPETVEQVQLKPIPRKKPEEKPAPEQVELKPISTPEQPELQEIETAEAEVAAPATEAKKKRPKAKKAKSVEEQLPDEIVEQPKATKAKAPKKQVDFKVDVENIEAEDISDEEQPAPEPFQGVIKPPRFVKKLQPQQCQANGPTILECQIDGAPFPEVKWYFKNKELKASENYVMTVWENVAKLEIKKVTATEIGKYACEARNIGGIAVTRTNIALGKFTVFIILFMRRRFCLDSTQVNMIDFA